MIAVLLLSFLQLSAAALIRNKDSMMMDEMQGILYDLPDYDDPELLEYELNAMGAPPMVSLFHFPNKQPNNKNRHVPPKEALANIKLELGEIITMLQTVETSLEKGPGAVNYEDIEKSIEGLKGIEHFFRPNIREIIYSMRHGGLMPHPALKPSIVRVIPSKRPFTTEISTTKPTVYEIKLLTTEATIHEMKPLKFPATVAPIQELQGMEPHVTENPIHEMKPQVTEVPDVALEPPVTKDHVESAHEIEKKPVYKKELFKSESVKEMYERNPYQSHWTWKTGGFA